MFLTLSKKNGDWETAVPLRWRPEVAIHLLRVS
jgi:hypothetical protein